MSQKVNLQLMKIIVTDGILAKCTISDHDPATRALNILDQKDNALRECLKIIQSELEDLE